MLTALKNCAHLRPDGCAEGMPAHPSSLTALLGSRVREVLDLPVAFRGALGRGCSGDRPRDEDGAGRPSPQVSADCRPDLVIDDLSDPVERF